MIGETIGVYVERRLNILNTSSSFAEQFSSSTLRMVSGLPNHKARAGEVFQGMMRPYNAITTEFSNDIRSVSFTQFLVSPNRRGTLGFTDPNYQIQITDTSIADINHQPYILVRVMNNNEVEIRLSDDGYNTVSINSWACDSPESFEQQLQNPRLVKTLELFGIKLPIMVKRKK